jgi:hypothetical protein
MCPQPRWAILVLCLLLFGMFALPFAFTPDAPGSTKAALRDTGLLPENLPAMQWIKLDGDPATGPYFRRDHSGAVYLPGRQSLLLLGADTHMVDFDNSIYELHLADRRWTWEKHQPASPPYTLRTDASGYRIAGLEKVVPWPAHAYDGIAYDPRDESVLVTGGPRHLFFPVVGFQADPTWSYSPSTHDWRTIAADSDETPAFFATGLVYDPGRDTFIDYGALVDQDASVGISDEYFAARAGTWELGPDREQWQRVTDFTPPWDRFNSIFDRRASLLLLFGGGIQDDQGIWTYRPGSSPGATGVWEQIIPGGDECPDTYYTPAAYDTKRQITLLLPLDRASNTNMTCLYDSRDNRYTRLWGADLPRVGINYTLVYAEHLDLFVLLTGGFSRGLPLEIWVLRLDDTWREANAQSSIDDPVDPVFLYVPAPREDDQLSHQPQRKQLNAEDYQQDPEQQGRPLGQGHVEE